MAQEPLFPEEVGSLEPQEPRTDSVAFLWPVSLRQDFRQVCESNDVSMNDVLIRLLRQQLSTGQILSVVEQSRRHQKRKPSPGRSPKERSAA